MLLKLFVKEQSSRTSEQGIHIYLCFGGGLKMENVENEVRRLFEQWKEKRDWQDL